MLIEGLAGKPLHLLADIAADDIAQRIAERTSRSRERAARLEGAGQRRGDDKPIGPAGDGERGGTTGRESQPYLQRGGSSGLRDRRSASGLLAG